MPNINIYYEKNPSYRTIFSDGLIGGVTPTNNINLNFYSTRNSIPKSVRHEINSDGTIQDGGTTSEDSKEGIIREIEVGIYMTRETAKDMYNILKQIFHRDDV